jgi:hypothetical protein
VFNKFCVVHIDIPGQEFDARAIDDDVALLDFAVLTSLIGRVRELIGTL